MKLMKQELFTKLSKDSISKIVMCLENYSLWFQKDKNIHSSTNTMT